MKAARDHRDHLDDIRQAAQKALGFVRGMTYQDFLADDKTAFAVVRALEILGEAAKRIPQEIRDLGPRIPWRSMAAIRDKLIHDYVSVDLEVVWRTVAEDLPPLVPMIQRVIEQVAEADSGPRHDGGGA